MTNETIADIRRDAEAKFRELVESYMRRRAAFQTTVGAMQAFNTVFDRLEAAWKRERAKIEADALEVGGIVEAAHKREMSKNASKNEANFGQLSDCAKLREALAYLFTLIDMRKLVLDCDETEATYAVQVMLVECRAALAAPPRNCDLPKVVEDPWRAWLDDESNWEDGNPKLEIHEWLLATATEREGGAK